MAASGCLCLHLLPVYDCMCSLSMSTCVPCLCLHVFLPMSTCVPAYVYMCSLSMSTCVPCLCLHVFPVYVYMCSLSMSTCVPCLCLHVFPVYIYICSLSVPVSLFYLTVYHLSHVALGQHSFLSHCLPLVMCSTGPALFFI